MMKEDQGVPKAYAWVCPWHPQQIIKETQASKLGDAPCIPFFINNYQFVLPTSIFLLLHMSCALLGASSSLVFNLFIFVLFVVHNKLGPSMICLGEKHAPLL